MRKIRFIAQKEVYHILRDPRSLVIVFVMPILMTFLLLRVSGVTLLEKDIVQRRPGYRHYIEQLPGSRSTYHRSIR